MVKYFLFILIVISSPFANSQNKAVKPVHILMPAYNAEAYIVSSIQSVLNQNYPVKLLILNDGSTDDTVKNIKELSHEPSHSQILVRSIPTNKGVAHARIELIAWSKQLNPNAYIFWLDADDRFIDPSFIQEVVDQLEATQADICLYNFSIVYKEEKDKLNATGVMKDKEKLAQIIQTIRSFPHQTVQPLQLANLLEITSLGWVKAYAPTVQFPQPADCPFEDFVYMATLLKARKITALPADKEPIQYLRRSDSICGQRKAINFTQDIPTQLKKFFDTVLEQSKHASPEEKNQKRKLAQEFVHKKIEQYFSTLKTILENKSYPEINAETFVIYQEKVTELKEYMKKTS